MAKKLGRKKEVTLKNERFLQNLISGRFDTQVDAYIDGYELPHSDDKEVRRNRSRECSTILAKPHVRNRYNELKEQVTERSIVTKESITAELDENRLVAKTAEQAAAMNQATIAKAKMWGVMTDRVDHTSSDGSMTPADLTGAVMDALRRKHETDT